MVKIWCVWRQKSLKLSNLVKTEVKMRFHRQSSALRLEMVEPKVYVQCESYAAVLAFAASLPDHTAALRNEISFCFCVKGFSVHLSNLFQLASLSFLVLNSSLDLCMSSTCRPHVVHMSSTCPWSQFSNSARPRGWGEVAKSHFHGDSYAATPLRQAFPSAVFLHDTSALPEIGMQWRFQAMPWFQSWDASGFIRIPAAWWLISIGWVPLVWLVGRTRRVAYHYVHEIKSDYDEWQVTNSRIVSVSNDQCDQYWPIHSTDSKVQDPLHPAACAFGIRTNVPEDCLQERRTEWISSPMITDSTTDHGVCTPKEARSQTSPSPSEACHNFSKTIHRTINRTIKRSNERSIAVFPMFRSVKQAEPSDPAAAKVLSLGAVPNVAETCAPG